MILRRTCPVCKRHLPEDPAEADRVFPFCSQRCKQIDLFRWSEGKYAIIENIDPAVIELLKMQSDVPFDPDEDHPDADLYGAEGESFDSEGAV